MFGYESQVVNGQLINVAPGAAYDPIIFGAAYTDPGMWPRQGVYNEAPVLPSASLMTESAPASYGGGGTLVMPTATSIDGNPFHPTKSPLIAAIVLLIFSVAMLHFVHFR